MLTGTPASPLSKFASLLCIGVRGGSHIQFHKQKIWKILYGKTKTGTGSLFSLAGHLSVSNLPLDAKKDLNRVEDFLTTVTEAHVVAALRTALSSCNEDPERTPVGLANLLVDKVLDSFVDCTFEESPKNTGMWALRGKEVNVS